MSTTTKITLPGGEPGAEYLIAPRLRPVDVYGPGWAGVVRPGRKVLLVLGADGRWAEKPPAQAKAAQQVSIDAAYDRDTLIECYVSGQVSERQWQQHLSEDPKLAKRFVERMTARKDKRVTQAAFGLALGVFFVVLTLALLAVGAWVLPSY